MIDSNPIDTENATSEKSDALNQNVNANSSNINPGNYTPSKIYEVFSPKSANSSYVSLVGNTINLNNKKSKLTYLILLFILIPSLSIFAGVISPFLYFLFALEFGIYLIYNGYSNFSKHLLVANTPISKIESAPIGFGVFQVRFNPEDGEPLVSPLSKTPCSFYTISLLFAVETKGGVAVQNVANFSKGKKSTLYDGTGHLVTDLSSFYQLKGKYQAYYFRPKSKAGTVIKLDRYDEIVLPNELQQFKDIIDNSVKTGEDPDFAAALNSITFSTSSSNIGYPRFNTGEGLSKVLNETSWQLMEYCLPTNLDYIAAGFVDHTTAQLNGKPISKLVPDPRSKIFLLEPEGQVELTKKELNNAILSFIFGFIFLSVAFLFATYHSLYQCLIVTYSNGITYCHLLSGSVIPLS